MVTRIDRGRLAEIEHAKKLDKALKDHIPDLVQRNKMVDPDGKVRLDLTTLTLPELKYGESDSESLMMGSGGKNGGSGKGGGGSPQNSPKGGDGAEVVAGGGGDESAELTKVEIDFDDFVRMAQEMLLSDLELPTTIRPPAGGDLSVLDYEDSEIDLTGSPSDLMLEETMFEALARSARECGPDGEADYDVDLKIDGRYRADVPIYEDAGSALEVYVLDISGSISGRNILLIRQTIFVLWYYLERRYKTNRRRFIVFNDEAVSLSRKEFFRVESMGGTHISTGLEEALRAMDGCDGYVKFLFLFSDGDDSEKDNDAAIKLLGDIFARFDWISYACINEAEPSMRMRFNMAIHKLAEENPEKSVCVDLKDDAGIKENIKALLSRIT